MRFKDQKVLVVGGAGFVGSNLCHQLLQEGVKDLGIVDNLLSAERDNVPVDPRVSFFHNSIAEDRLLEKLDRDYDYVFHLATYHGNQSSMADPIADHDNNTLPTLKLCEHFKESKLKKFVYASAGCTVAKKTFDDVEATAEDAEISLYLDSPYQFSKIFGEFYGNYYWMRYKLPFVKARFQNVYGPREILGAGSWRGTPATVWRNVTPTFIWKSLNKGALPVENGGIASRDFIYVSDLVEGLLCCALYGEASGVYNLASGVETTIKDLSLLINGLCENETPIDFKPARNWDRSGKRFGDPTKAKKEIKFEAKENLRDGLKKTIAWTKENYDLIDRNIKKHIHFMPELGNNDE